MKNSKLEIPLSKRYMFTAFLVSIVFIYIGFYAIYAPESLVTIVFRNPHTIRIIGFIVFPFSILGFICAVIKGFDRKPGLILAEDGIYDNTVFTNIGFINWNDVIRIRSSQISSFKFLILETNHPEKYLNNAPNFWTKQVMKWNFKDYGSPLILTLSTLKIDPKEIEQILVAELKKRKDMAAKRS